MDESILFSGPHSPDRTKVYIRTKSKKELENDSKLADSRPGSKPNTGRRLSLAGRQGGYNKFVKSENTVSVDTTDPVKPRQGRIKQKEPKKLVELLN